MLYMIRFSLPLGNDRHQARYYLGYCKRGRLDERFQEHCAGQGARITAAAVAAGAKLELVWHDNRGTRRDERHLKRWKSHKMVLRYGKSWLSTRKRITGETTP